jgi:hypothetical protein
MTIFFENNIWLLDLAVQILIYFGFLWFWFRHFKLINWNYSIYVVSVLHRWFYSTNHKNIGTLCLIFRIVAGIIGTILSIFSLSTSEDAILNGNYQMYHSIILGHAFVMIFFIPILVVGTLGVEFWNWLVHTIHQFKIGVHANKVSESYNILHGGLGLPVTFWIIAFILNNMDTGSSYIQVIHDNIGWILIGISVTIIYNIFFNKNMSTTSKPNTTNTKALFGGDTGQDESNYESEDEDSTKNKEKKSRWDKTKDFFYEHKVIITMVVFGVVVIIIAYVYGSTPPPIPPNLPKNNLKKKNLGEKVPSLIFEENIQRNIITYKRIKKFIEEEISSKRVNNGTRFEYVKLMNSLNLNSCIEYAVKLRSTISKFVDLDKIDPRLSLDEKELALTTQWNLYLSVAIDCLQDIDRSITWGDINNHLNNIGDVHSGLEKIRINMYIRAKKFNVE